MKIFIKKKKVLVTGNTGFKGSWLTTWLLKLDAKVVGVSKDIPTNPSMFEILMPWEESKPARVDLAVPGVPERASR